MSYVLTPHAIERYRERVRPTLDRHAAEEDLRRLLRLATVERGRPSWVAEENAQTTGYLFVGEDIALPFGEAPSGKRIVFTCLTRSGFSPERRAAKNAHRRRVRQRRMHMRNKQLERMRAKKNRLADLA